MDPFYSIYSEYTLRDAENQTTRGCQTKIFVTSRNNFSGWAVTSSPVIAHTEMSSVRAGFTQTRSISLGTFFPARLTDKAKPF